MIYDKAEASLKSLTGSTVRCKILLALRDKPMALKPLVETVGASSSTILHVIYGMAPEIRKVDKVYQLTSKSRIEAELLSRMVSGLIALDENASFWRDHDISSIPAALLADIGQLAKCDTVRDNNHTVMTSLANFIDLVGRAKQVHGVSSVIAPGHVELVDGLLKDGSEVSLILTRAVIDLIPEEILASWMKRPNFGLWEAPSGTKAAFTIADDVLSLGLYLPSGKYDTDQDLVCRGDGAAGWGMRLWEYYKVKSTKIN